MVGESEGEPIDEGQGLLVLERPWPSMLRGLYKEDDRFVETYFSQFGVERYLVGDAARRDGDGYFWVIGRIDDVVNVSGHRLSTAEVESAIVAHEKVAEAAVIGQSDEDTGQAICAFVTLSGDTEPSDELVDGDPRHGRRADRQIRPPEADHLGRRPAQDPLRQDHAPAAARHRRRPGPGRRHHPARPGRDGGAGGEDRRGAATRTRDVRLGEGRVPLPLAGIFASKLASLSLSQRCENRTPRAPGAPDPPTGAPLFDSSSVTEAGGASEYPSL